MADWFEDLDLLDDDQFWEIYGCSKEDFVPPREDVEDIAADMEFDGRGE